MRNAFFLPLLLALGCTLAACKGASNDEQHEDHDHGALSSEELRAPGALERPPTRGLPDSLRPPR